MKKTQPVLTKLTFDNVARQYRSQYGKEMATMRLAKIMYGKEKPLFTSVEHARSALRRIEGKNGEHHRKRMVNTEYFMKEERPRNPYNLPESDEREYVPYNLKGKRVAVLADIHAPYHSIAALTTTIDFLKKEKPDVVLINGDLFDFYKLSRFCIDPRKRNFAEEIQIGCDLIKILQDKIKARVIFKLGNHDIRLAHYIFHRADALVGFEDFELKNIIIKRLPDITIVDDKTLITANELTILHGHEFGMSVFSPVNIARGLFLRGKANAICGHHHRTSSHTETTLQGKMIATWSVGCLSELHPEYLPINNWNHGFAMVDLGNETGFEVRNYKIYKGKVV